MIRMSSVVLVSALLLGGCDRAPSQEVQPEVQAGSQTASAGAPAPPPLPGQIVRFKAGASIPAVTVVDPQGNTLELATIGKPVLLNLWATWCAPCKVEMPLLDNLADKLEGEVKVLTVSQDVRDPEAVVPAFFAQEGFKNLEPWLDKKADLGLALADGGLLPTTVLYDAQGKEVFRVSGDYAWDSADTVAKIREALAK